MGLVDKIADLYVMYRQKYVLEKPGGLIVTVQKPLTDAVIYGHVKCAYAIGVFAGPKATKFICFDVDEYDKDKVHRLVDMIESTGIDRDKIYVSSSGGKGFHVEVFFDSFVYNTVAENYYKLVLAKCHISQNKVEFRPTRSQSIKVPLSVHPRTGNRCWYVDRETLECIMDEKYIYGIEKFSADRFADIVYALNKERWKERFENSDGVVEWSELKKRRVSAEFDKMPALKRMGSRHQLMLKIGAVERIKGIEQEQIVEDLMQWYELQDQALIDSSPEEVRADAISIAKWVWSDKFTPTWEFTPKESKQNNIEKPSESIVTVDDIYRILTVQTKSGRRLLFLITAYCRRMGALIMGQDKIGEIIGCTMMTVSRSVNMLDERGLVKIKTGGIKFMNGRKLYKANKYKVDIDENTEGYIISGDITAENFDDIYYGALGSLCSDEELATSLTKGEIEECRRRRLV